MGTVITLTTDFGNQDSYVATMKGVILGINPAAQLVDICHSIAPQNIPQAAFVLGTAYCYFPPGTIHLAVVDPGVGSKRRAVILHTPVADFVAPDNGVLSYVIRGLASKSVRGRARLQPGTMAVSLTNPEYWLKPVSATFHGRDIFAPVAAHLSLGKPAEVFGEKIASLVTLALPRPCRTAEGTLAGRIIHIDTFGNLITSIREAELPRRRQSLEITAGGHTVRGLCRTYADSTGLLALLGSSGYLEISLPKGSAQSFLGVGIGDRVTISTRSGGRQ